MESQILEQVPAGFSTGVAASKFTELDHRTAPIVTRKLRGYVYCRGGTEASDDQLLRFALIKLKAGVSVVTTGSFDDVSSNVYEIDCVCNRDGDHTSQQTWVQDRAAWFHFDVDFGVTIPLDWSVWFGLENVGAITNFAAFVVRLFWNRISF